MQNFPYFFLFKKILKVYIFLWKFLAPQTKVINTVLFIKFFPFFPELNQETVIIRVG